MAKLFYVFLILAIAGGAAQASERPSPEYLEIAPYNGGICSLKQMDLICGSHGLNGRGRAILERGVEEAVKNSVAPDAFGTAQDCSRGVPVSPAKRVCHMFTPTVFWNGFVMAIAKTDPEMSCLGAMILQITFTHDSFTLPARIGEIAESVGQVVGALCPLR